MTGKQLELAGKLAIRGRFSPAEELSIAYREDGRWESAGAPPADRAARDRVLDCLRDAQEAPDASGIAEATGLVLKTVQNVLSELSRGPAPLVEAVGTGRRGDPRRFLIRSDSEPDAENARAQDDDLVARADGQATTAGIDDPDFDPFYVEPIEDEPAPMLWGGP